MKRVRVFWTMVCASALVSVVGLASAETLDKTSRTSNEAAQQSCAEQGSFMVAAAEGEQAPSGEVQERAVPRPPMPGAAMPLDPRTLPKPVLAFTGVILSEKLTGPKRHKLAVTNHAAYPNAMFAPAPNLPPCGQNTNASRTWVNIYDATTKSYIHGFCALRSSGELVNLWFDVRHGEARPSQVYVVMDDRQANKQYISDPVTIH